MIITLLNVFVSSGFGSALVQKKNSDEIDFNTAFWISFSLSVVLYLILFFTAPLIADFYEIKQLTWVIRVLGIRLIISSLNNIQQAFLRKKMQFKKFFWATFIGTIISGGVGIMLATLGFGVWALVFQYLTNVFIDTAILFFVCGWKPKCQFSFESGKQIWGFGWKVLATELVFTIEGDIRSLIIGKAFGSSDLAFYDQGKKYPSLFVTNINSSIQKVMLPAYSKIQDDRVKLLASLRKSVSVGIYILAPLLIGFAVVAHTFVSVVLTDKWLPCVPYIQIFCLYFLTRPLESSCHQALLAIGKSGLILKIMIIIHSFSLTGVLFAVFVLKSVMWIAIFSLISTCISIVLFLFFSKKYLDYRFYEVIIDIVPSLLAVGIMGTAVYLIGLIPMHSIILLIAQVLTGCVVYLALSFLFRIKPFIYLCKKIKRFLYRKKTTLYN